MEHSNQSEQDFLLTRMLAFTSGTKSSFRHSLAVSVLQEFRKMKVPGVRRSLVRPPCGLGYYLP